jgi:hypothetical protein
MTQTPITVTIRRPSCWSQRTCSAHTNGIYIIGIRNFRAKILRVIEPIKGAEPRYTSITLSNDILVVSYYQTTRGNAYITIYKPKELDIELAKALALKALGFYDYNVTVAPHVEVKDFDALVQQQNQQ